MNKGMKGWDLYGYENWIVRLVGWSLAFLSMYVCMYIYIGMES